MRKNDINGFSSCADELFEIIDKMEETAQKSPYYSLDRWLGEARELAEGTDDFSRNLYMLNARALVTTWGAYNQAETGGLRDYSNKQWSGLFSKFYKKRWEMWTRAKLKEADGAPPQEIDWFGWEWNWVRQR